MHRGEADCALATRRFEVEDFAKQIQGDGVANTWLAASQISDFPDSLPGFLASRLAQESDWHGMFCDCGMRVLIADDQKSVGTALAELVRLCQHEVVEVVGSGLEAIHAYGQHRPDVVLMDYQMPKLNGATACRNILAKHPTARVILVCGGLPDDFANSGALAVLAKPVRMEQLYAALYDAGSPPTLCADDRTP